MAATSGTLSAVSMLARPTTAHGRTLAAELTSSKTECASCRRRLVR